MFNRMDSEVMKMMRRKSLAPCELIAEVYIPSSFSIAVTKTRQ